MALGGGFLDGTRWEITVVPEKATADAGIKQFNTTLTFADGKLSSSELSAKGFKPVAYRGETEESESEFEAEQMSETDGVAAWLGEIHGGRIVGRLQWKKKDGAQLSFNFSGTKVSH